MKSKPSVRDRLRQTLCAKTDASALAGPNAHFHDRTTVALNMQPQEYEDWSRRRAAEFVAKGHHDQTALRELLILTTNKISEPTVSEYFRGHHNDKELLQNLINIALEGEDAGDAPWAAANTIAEFPAAMLADHKAELEIISQFEWSYLSTPARIALAKIDPDGT